MADRRGGLLPTEALVSAGACTACVRGWAGTGTDHLVALRLDLLLLILWPLKGVLAEEHDKQHYPARPHIHRLAVVVARVTLRDDLWRCKHPVPGSGTT